MSNKSVDWLTVIFWHIEYWSRINTVRWSDQWWYWSAVRRSGSPGFSVLLQLVFVSNEVIDEVIDAFLYFYIWSLKLNSCWFSSYFCMKLKCLSCVSVCLRLPRLLHWCQCYSVRSLTRSITQLLIRKLYIFSAARTGWGSDYWLLPMHNFNESTRSLQASVSYQ